MDLINDALLAFLAILPVVDPFSAPPLFIFITEGLTDEERKKQALKACLYAFSILLVALVAGTFILKFFSISLPAVQIAGGLLIARTGFRMLGSQHHDDQTNAEEKESREKEDIFFVPMAMPLLSGPGSIAVMINLATGVRHWGQWLVISAAAALVCLITYFMLAESVRLMRVLGVSGMNALSKLMGFLLLSLAVQFIINGISSSLMTLATHLNATL